MSSIFVFINSPATLYRYINDTTPIRNGSNVFENTTFLSTNAHSTVSRMTRALFGLHTREPCKALTINKFFQFVSFSVARSLLPQFLSLFLAPSQTDSLCPFLDRKLRSLQQKLAHQSIMGTSQENSSQSCLDSYIQDSSHYSFLFTFSLLFILS